MPVAYSGDRNMSKIEIATIEAELKRLAIWHNQNRRALGFPDDETNDQAWNRGFGSGYESGRMELIKSLIGMIAMLKIKEEAENE